MTDPIAAADQAEKEMEGLARVHTAYWKTLIACGMDEFNATSTLHTFMWVMASQNQNSEEDDD